LLASFAHHYKTGEPIPAELVERMNRAGAFGRANATAAQISYTAISYDIYKGNPKNVDLDAVTLCRHEALHTNHAPNGHPHVRLIRTFEQLLIGLLHVHVGQSDRGRLLPPVRSRQPSLGGCAMRYRRVVLEPGGSMSANDLVKNFLGRQQNMTAFQRWMGEEF